MLIVVAYDVPDDRRRGRLAHALKDFGERVNYSVFECHLKASELDRLRRRALGLIDAEEDSLRIYRMCAECAPRREAHGVGRPTEDPDVYIV